MQKNCAQDKLCKKKKKKKKAACIASSPEKNSCIFCQTILKRKLKKCTRDFAGKNYCVGNLIKKNLGSLIYIST